MCYNFTPTRSEEISMPVEINVVHRMVLWTNRRQSAWIISRECGKVADSFAMMPIALNLRTEVSIK